MRNEDAGFDCDGCGRRIGKTRTHYLLGDDVLCLKCVEARDYPAGIKSCTRAAVRILKRMRSPS